MSQNKRAPRELAKYVVHLVQKEGGGIREVFQYFSTQKIARTWARSKEGKKRLFRINYDYYGDLK